MPSSCALSGRLAIGARASLLWQHSAEREMSASACTRSMPGYSLQYSQVFFQHKCTVIIVQVKVYCCWLQVSLAVEQSDSFELLVSDARNNSYNMSRRARSTASVGRLTVCARTTATHSFHLVARQLGHINFTVHVLTYLLLISHAHQLKGHFRHGLAGCTVIFIVLLFWICASVRYLYPGQRPRWGWEVSRLLAQSSGTVYQPLCELQLSPLWRSLDIWRPTCLADRQRVWGLFMTRSTNPLIIMILGEKAKLWCSLAPMHRSTVRPVGPHLTYLPFLATPRHHYPVARCYISREHSEGEMYSDHGHLCVRVSVCPSPYSQTTARTRM